MSLGKSVLFDPQIVAVICASSCPAEARREIFGLSVKVLEGTLTRDNVASVSVSASQTAAQVVELANAVSILLWECVKGVQGRDLTSLKAMLLAAGLSEDLAVVFVETFRENRERLYNLKGALAISSKRYKDLTWRLDVELARRDMRVTTHPKYMLRLDVFDQREGGCGNPSIESFHLEAEYANLKRVQTELQRALDELASPHCDRLLRYIS